MRSLNCKLNFFLTLASPFFTQNSKIECYISILLGNDEEENFRQTNLNFKKLSYNEENEEVFTLNGRSFVDIKYKLIGNKTDNDNTNEKFIQITNENIGKKSNRYSAIFEPKCTIVGRSLKNSNNSTRTIFNKPSSQHTFIPSTKGVDKGNKKNHLINHLLSPKANQNQLTDTASSKNNNNNNKDNLNIGHIFNEINININLNLNTPLTNKNSQKNSIFKRFSSSDKFNTKQHEKSEDYNISSKYQHQTINKNNINLINNSEEFSDTNCLMEEYEILNYKEINSDINKNKENNIKAENNFCNCIFVSGLAESLDTKNTIPNSCNFKAACGHETCSMLPSYVPEITNFYSSNKEKFENLKEYLPYVSFPLGIKLCYECMIDPNTNKIVNLNKYQDIFYNNFKTDKGETYYIATFQYYIRMKRTDFQKKYKFDPFTKYMEYIEKSFPVTKKKDKKSQEKMQIISHQLNNEYIFVPESFNLLSKKPYFNELKKCLLSIAYLQNEDKNNILNHLINEAPLPNNFFNINLYIPKYMNKLSLLSDKCLRMNNKYNINSILLFDVFPIDDIIYIFIFLLLEQKMVIVGNDNSIVTKVVYLFLTLIYPFTWTNPFVPLLTAKNYQFVQSPVPIFMGMNKELLNLSLIDSNVSVPDDIIVYDLDIKHFADKTHKKWNKKEIFNQLNLPNLPQKINELFIKEFKNIQVKISTNKKTEIEDDYSFKRKIDIDIREVFIKIMAILFGDVNYFIVYSNKENMPLFNRDNYIEFLKEKDLKAFVSAVINTQNFTQFIMNEQIRFYNNFTLKSGLTEDSSLSQEEIIDTYYYYEIINKKTLIQEKIEKKYRNDSPAKKKISSKNIKIKINKILFETIHSNDLKVNSSTNKAINLELRLEKEKSHRILNKFALIKNRWFNKTKDNKEDSHEIKKPEDELESSINEERLFTSNIQQDYTSRNFITLSKNFYEMKIDSEYEYNDFFIKIIDYFFRRKTKNFLLYPYFLPKDRQNQILDDDSIIINIKNYHKNKEIKFIDENINNAFIINKKKEYSFNNIITKKYYDLENHLKIESLKVEDIVDIYKKIKMKLSKIGVTSNIKDILILKILKYIEIDKYIEKNNKNEKTEEFQKFASTKAKSLFLTKETETQSQLSLEELDKISKSFENQENIKYLSNIIFFDYSLFNQINHKCLAKSSYNDLLTIIKMAFDHLEESEIDTGINLTLSIFVYFKDMNDEGKEYLFEKLNNTASPCKKIWKNENFWYELFKRDILENGENISKLKNLLKNYNDNNDELEYIKYLILLDSGTSIYKIMNKLNLDNSYIEKVLKNNILNKYGLSEVNLDKIFEDIKNYSI